VLSSQATRIYDAEGGGFLATGTRERTPWFLVFLAFLLPTLPAYLVPLGKYWLSPLRLIPLLMLVLVIVGFLLKPRPRQSQTRTLKPGVLLILAFALLQSTSYVTSDLVSDPDLIRGTQLLSSELLAGWVGISLYTMSRVSTARQRNIVMGVLLVGLTYACLVAGLQNYAGIDLRLSLQPPGLEEMPALSGSGGPNTPTLLRYGAQRSRGTVDYPIEMSTMAAMAVILAIHFARYGTTRARRQLAAAAIVIALVGLLAAGSRTGVVALCVALLFYAPAFKIRQFLKGVLGAGVALFLLARAFPTNFQILWKSITEGAAGQEGSVNVRLAKAAVAPELFHRYPIFGIGANTFPRGIDVWDNQWVGSITQGGLVAASALALLIIGGIVGTTAAVRAAKTPPERDAARTVGAMFLGIASTSFTNDVFLSTQLTLMWFLVLGLLWSGVTMQIGDYGKRARRPEPLGSLVAG